ncbi:hypothetical protein FWK35_00008970, partial [Aphis craccivora]
MMLRVFYKKIDLVENWFCLKISVF